MSAKSRRVRSERRLERSRQGRSHDRTLPFLYCAYRVQGGYFFVTVAEIGQDLIGVLAQ